jgi:hypothetical protein
MQLWLGGHSPRATMARRYAESRAFQPKLIFYTMLAEVIHSRQVAILKTA